MNKEYIDEWTERQIMNIMRELGFKHEGATGMDMLDYRTFHIDTIREALEKAHAFGRMVEEEKQQAENGGIE